MENKNTATTDTRTIYGVTLSVSGEWVGAFRAVSADDAANHARMLLGYRAAVTVVESKNQGDLS